MEVHQAFALWCNRQGAGVFEGYYPDPDRVRELETRYEAAVPSEGHHSYNQMATINYLCSKYKFNKTLEIGSLFGRSAYVILDSSLPTCTIDCIDTFQYSLEGKATAPSYLEKFKKNTQRFANQIQIYEDYSYNVVNKFTDRTYDAIFIDGDHSYQGTFTDILLYYKKLKPGGIMFGHDYPSILPEPTDFNGVLHSVNGLIRDRPDVFYNFGYYGGIWAAQYGGTTYKAAS